MPSITDSCGKIFDLIKQFGQKWFTTTECECCCHRSLCAFHISCSNGHIICHRCLKRFVQESVLFRGTSTLGCLAFSNSKCDGQFSDASLRSMLPRKLYKRFSNLQFKEVTEQAGIRNLLQCFHCQFVVELDSCFQVLNCPRCHKKTCRLCREAGHEPLPCGQVQASRIEVEEAMTAARLRYCPKCNTPFFKSGGCNAVTCPQCYSYFKYECRCRQHTKYCTMPITEHMDMEQVKRVGKETKEKLIKEGKWLK